MVDLANERMMVSATEAEALIEGLVSIASPSTQEHDAVRYLVDWMQAHGYDQAFVDEAGNAVGIMGTGSREIVLLGHIDTFGGMPPVRRDGRLLYGRGSVDAKGSLCMFAVATQLAELSPDVRVVVIGAVEEEAPSSKGAHFVMTQYQPEICLIGEPSHWDRITLGYKGRLLIEWTWRGGLSHSAGQEASAGERAFAYWGHVLNLTQTINHGKTRIFEQLDATLQEITSGQDGEFGWARMVIGFRVPPDLDVDALLGQLGVVGDGEGIRPYGQERAHQCDKDTAVTRALRGAIRAQGGTPRFVHKTGTSDMNVVSHGWDCPMAAYGPGDSALDHTPQEHLDLDEYWQAIQVLARALGRL